MDVTEKIKNDINRNGPMPINVFMRQALSSKHGYYQLENPIGAKGDFITAPEISQLFGEIIGVWAATKWQETLLNKLFNLIELGPGKGTLMADLLRATKKTRMHENQSVFFIEINKLLKAKQEKANENYNIKWEKKFDNIPNRPSLIIANEFFDALPVIQYIKRKRRWYELMVNIKKDSNDLTISDEPIDEVTNDTLKDEYPYVPVDSIIENQVESKNLIRKICKLLNKQGGSCLIIDYGFTEDMRHRNSYISTLQAIKNHKFSNIFKSIGNSDLSTQVNFTQIANTAKINGCKVQIKTQREFLLESGIELRKDMLLKHSNAKQRSDIISGYNRLIDKDKMGNLFKVLIIDPK